jgi:hypothetical protein
MKGQRIGGYAERGRDLARRHSIGTGLHEQPEGIEPIFLGKCRKRGDGIILFHISIIMEINLTVKHVFFKRSADNPSNRLDFAGPRDHSPVSQLSPRLFIRPQNDQS